MSKVLCLPHAIHSGRPDNSPGPRLSLTPWSAAREGERQGKGEGKGGEEGGRGARRVRR